MGIFYTVLVVLILILLAKSQVAISRMRSTGNDNDAFRTGFIVFFVNLLDFFSTLYFWYLFFMIGYWFVFFKLQERVFCFIPTHKTYWENFEQYDWLFGWVTGCKLVYVIFKVYFDQSSFDVFMIDWERPKPQESQVPIQRQNEDQKQRTDVSKMDVNAWRQLFLVNELNEVSNYKIINTNVTLLLYGLFMEGFGLRWWTNEDPNLNNSKNNAEENWVVFFFVSTLVIYVISAV